MRIPMQNDVMSMVMVANEALYYSFYFKVFGYKNKIILYDVNVVA